MSDEDLEPAGTSAPAPAAPSSASVGVRPASGRLGMLALVTAGGAAGTSVRAVLTAAVDATPPSWPWATFAVNLSGALVLGFLLGMLARTGPDSGWRRGVRLALGTGFLGGYTTYSTFAVEILALSGPAPHLAGVGYAMASVALGTAAAAGGYLLASRVRVPPSWRTP